MYLINQNGWIEVICGSMFSGKSEELIRRASYAICETTCNVFKPCIDNRYSEEDVVSHNGLKVKAVPVSASKDIFEHITEEMDVIAIDEVQFFDGDIVEVVQVLANRGYRVIVAGLDQDFRGLPFGQVPQLMAIAEHVTKLQAVCSACGSPASRTQRLIDGEPAAFDDPIILVGASESYEPRCRHCHAVPTNKDK